MPKTIFDKYSKPAPNYLAEYLRACKKAKHMTSDMIAERTKEHPVTVRVKLNQPADKWTIGDLKQYCGILGADVSEALRLVTI